MEIDNNIVTCIIIYFIGNEERYHIGIERGLLLDTFMNKI